jgi:hypothetical protein
MADIPIPSLRGGYNDTDPAQLLNDDEVVTAMNVEFFASACGERRGGTAPLDLTSSGLTGQGGIVHLSQWFPTNVVTAAEYIAVAATPGSSTAVARRDTSGTWHTISPTDAINNAAPDIFGINAQPFDAVDFLAYHSGVDRLHGWDGTNLRRIGLAQPAAPAVTDTGSGTFGGPRYYRVRYIVESGGLPVRRSEPSLSTRFTPSGSGAGASIAKPAAISEGETDWEIEASEDDDFYYRIATRPVGTTTYEDSIASSKTYASAVVSAPVSNQGGSITYVLLSDQAAALNLTGTISNGGYSNPGGTIWDRGWIGYTSGGVYIPNFQQVTWTAGQNWWASPDVAAALEGAASGNSGNYEANGTLSDAIGAYLTIPSAKFLIVDGDRLVYGGHWTNAALASTVGWTPVKNDPGVGNAERAPIVTTGGEAINNTQDLDNYDGGGLTGLASTSFGYWFAFKWQRIYAAIRQQNVVNAYSISTVSTTRGAITGSVIRAGNNDGTGAIYFLDPFVGPCRLTAGGVVNPIYGLRNTWKRINLAATSVVCCGCYYPYKQQIEWFISVDGGNTPTLGITIQTSSLAYDTNGLLRGGISLMTGRRAQAQCAAALTYTVGNQTTDFPFVGLTSPDFVQRCDTGTDDNGTAFTATITTKPIYATGLLNRWGVRAVEALMTADANGSVSMALVRDMGVETTAPIVQSLAPVNSESQVLVQYDNLVMSDARAIQVTMTDGAAGKNWQAQRIDLKPRSEETA